MTEHNRYFLDIDPKIVGEDSLAIRLESSSIEGSAPLTVRRGILNGPYTEEEKWEYVLTLINRLEHLVEKSQV